MKQVYDLTIEPLTAVHVGSGETLLPIDYTLASPGNSNVSRYVKFNSDKIIDGIIKSGKQTLINELEKANDSADINVLGKFFRKYFYRGVSYDASTTKSFRNLYADKIRGSLSDNALEVQQMMHEENRPYIPGSSIKGSIRTAVLNSLLDEVDDKTFNELGKLPDKKVQNELLGITKEGRGNDAQKDPFRCVEVSDSIFPARAQLVGQMKNAKLDRRSGEMAFVDMQIIAETIPGLLADGKSPAEFSIRINSDLQNFNSGDFNISKKIDFNKIARACNNFFKRQFNEEYKHFYKDAYDGMDKILELKKFIDSVDVNDTEKFLLRLGHWSQVEYVTLEDLRKPKTPTRKGKAMPYGTTRTLFDFDGQYLPLGWCVCTVKK